MCIFHRFGHHIMSNAGASLLSLPPELLRKMFGNDHPFEGVILRFVSKRFRSVLGPPSQQLHRLHDCPDIRATVMKPDRLRKLAQVNGASALPHQLAVEYAYRNIYRKLTGWLLQNFAPCSKCLWLCMLRDPGPDNQHVLEIYKSRPGACICDCHNDIYIHLVWCICKTLGCKKPRGVRYTDHVPFTRLDFDEHLRSIPGEYLVTPQKNGTPAEGLLPTNLDPWSS